MSDADTEKEKLDNFERAFSLRTSGCRRECHCGSVFFDEGNTYDWDDGELEDLRQRAEATRNGPAAPVFEPGYMEEPEPKKERPVYAVDFSPGSLMFEGKEYVDACDCWHERAKHIMKFIDGHAHGIAEYLTREKRRKVQDAEMIARTAPVVDPEPPIRDNKRTRRKFA